ncbi:MAG: hypothetical protein JXA25_00295 [Anaerolineales bacterium]|nr:hypothetical protein [Anaerolineales bacterium]
MANVSTADFVGGGSSASVTNVTAGFDSVYDLTVSGSDLASFNGTVGLDLAGNALSGSEPSTDETYTVDNSPPVLTSFTQGRHPRVPPMQIH